MCEPTGFLDCAPSKRPGDIVINQPQHNKYIVTSTLIDITVTAHKNLKEFELNDPQFDTKNIAETAHLQMIREKNEKYKPADYKNGTTFVTKDKQTTEMNNKHYQLLPFAIDSGGRMGHIASNYYYDTFDKLYVKHDIHQRLTKSPRTLLSRSTKLLMDRAIQDSCPKNILNEADANWKKTYLTK